MMNQRPPMQGIANQMAQHGRYGDSMLVHMNPIEVQGIAALSPTGSLTTNPVTGQPEAFLPFLAPLLGSFLGSTFLTGSTLGVLGSGLSSAAAGAIGSGLATTAATGDLKKGILSGLTGYGVGQALGAASDALNPEIVNLEGALEGAGDAVGAVDTAAQTGAELAGAQAELAAMPDLTATADVSMAVPPSDATMAGGDLFGATRPGVDPAYLSKMEEVQKLQSQFAGQQAKIGELKSSLAAERAALTPMERAAAPFANPGTFGKALIKPTNLAAIGVGEGQRGAIEMEEQFARDAKRFQDERDAELERARQNMRSAYGQLESDYPGYKIPGYQTGGITSVNPNNYMSNLRGLQALAGGGRTVQNFNEGGRFNRGEYDDYIGNLPVFGAGTAAQRQANIRGSQVISPAQLQGYRPGFGPEINYFQSPADNTPPGGFNPPGNGGGDDSGGGGGGGGGGGDFPPGGDLPPGGRPPFVNPDPPNENIAPSPPYYSQPPVYTAPIKGDPITKLPPITSLPPVSEPPAQMPPPPVGSPGRDPFIDPISPSGGIGDFDLTEFMSAPENQEGIANLTSFIGSEGVNQLTSTLPNYFSKAPQERSSTMPADTVAAMTSQSTDVTGAPYFMVAGQRYTDRDRAIAEARGLGDPGGIEFFSAEGELISGRPQLTAEQLEEQRLANERALADFRESQRRNEERKAAIADITQQYSGQEYQSAIDPKDFYTIESGALEGIKFGSFDDAKTALERANLGGRSNAADLYDTSQVGMMGTALDRIKSSAGKEMFKSASSEGRHGGVFATRDEAIKDMVDRGISRDRADRLVRSFAEGGETEMSPDQGTRIIDLTIAAVMGQLPEEQAETIINRFVDEFGSEAFAILRRQVLQGNVPGAQTEGKINGNGGGMDDKVPGMIGDQQPVAVSPGEFIVPADVVSGLGDGSTDAGVEELHGMMDRVRSERTGIKQQPRPVNKAKVMPV